MEIVTIPLGQKKKKIQHLHIFIYEPHTNLYYYPPLLLVITPLQKNEIKHAHTRIHYHNTLSLTRITYVYVRDKDKEINVVSVREKL